MPIFTVPGPSGPDKLSLAIFPKSRTASTMEGALFVCVTIWLVFVRKLTGKIAKESNFTRFSGFRYRSIPSERLRRPYNRA